MTEQDVGKLYPVAKAVLTPIFRACWRLDLQGLEHIPASGGAILCANHTSVLDSFFVPVSLPRRITYVGKAEYLDSWKTRKLFPALGMIPIDRTGGDAAERALATAQRILERGELFGIYPEGTRSRDGRLYRGKTGPARLALRANVPIIPVGIRGSREVMPPDAKLPKVRQTVTIRFGAPIDVSRYADRSSDHLVLRQIIDEVMYEIRQLSGQEYVNEYASRRAREEPGTAIDLRATPTVEPVRTPDEAVGTSTVPTERPVALADDVTAGSGSGRGHNGSNRSQGRNGGDHRVAARSEHHDSEFVTATRPRSSAELLRNPPRRAHLTDNARQ